MKNESKGEREKGRKGENGDYISNIYKAPLTAEKFLIGLYDAIFSLENSAESLGVSTKSDILKYGINARSIIFRVCL